ncbi:tRNA wybutosine-synthesizing protein 2-like [Holothuria leucospilota]|uniref:tRNA(Phe) (4-demethylwyosine(37)-C(7)) aminocarboxypropyltransferase n=1 Tax=Holothuria leucospilota TaxID=206669 RepID=A0A9Q1CP58_HOLLE|nr:tRNA wybutosine-synthesizing protein 2-like [Holothuria leucospilota]
MDAVQVSQNYAQRMRQLLEKHGLSDGTRKLQHYPESNSVLIPITMDYKAKLPSLISSEVSKSECHVAQQMANSLHTTPDQSHDKHLQTLCLEGIQGILVKACLPPSRLSKLVTPHDRLMEGLRKVVILEGHSWTDELAADVPRHWEVHGDLVMLSGSAFRLSRQLLGESLWEVVAEALCCKRLAKKNRVQCDDFRTPAVEMLLGDNSWVEHIDNGIRYCYDILHSMFSAGNITEKLRITSFQCQGETVVDLYAGIGYFSLPYLVHAGAEFVHACEWNPHAVKALERNLELNGVKNRCQIHFGDNKKVCPKSVADRVNLGLIPSSEDAWPVACTALKPSGGILHIHGNVESYPGMQRSDGNLKEVEESVNSGCLDDKSYNSDNRLLEQSSSICGSSCEQDFVEQLRKKNKYWGSWVRHIEDEIRRLMENIYNKTWNVNVYHVEHVKSYAPHVDHLVADVTCRPKGPND